MSDVGGAVWSVWWSLLVFPGAAEAADAGAILSLLEKDNIEGARRKCEKEDAAQGGDADLREACAQAWYDEIAEADTLEGWKGFAAQWSGTSWGAKATKRASDLALSELGYAATEAQYLEVASTYPDTEAAQLAHERAGVAALQAIRTPEGAREVAARYPGRAEDLVREHLGAFVSADVGLDGITGIAIEPPLIDAAELTAGYAGRDGEGLLRMWEEIAAARLDRYGLKGAFPPASSGPPYALCADPAEPGLVPGAVITGGGGMAFVPGPYTPSCAPTSPPVLLVSDGQGPVAITGGPGHLVELDRGHGPLAPTLALVAGEPGALHVVPGGAVVARPVVDGDQSRWGVAPLDGTMPWVTGAPPAGAIPLPDAARLALPEGWSLAAPSEDGASHVAVVGGEEGWLVPAGVATAIAPQVHAAMGYDPAAVVAPPAAWVGDLPAGAVPVELKSASWSALRPALEALGVATSKLRYSKLYELDLDGDASPELVAELSVGGRRAVAVYSAAGDRLWARVATTDDAATGGGSALAFALEGRTWLAWRGDAYTEVLWAAGAGIGHAVLANPG